MSLDSIKSPVSSTQLKRFEDSLARIYPGIIIKYNEDGEDFNVSLKSGKPIININKKKLDTDKISKYSSLIIGKIELTKLIADLKNSGDTQDLDIYNKYSNTSKAYSLFYRFLFQIVTLNNLNIPPMYYSDLKLSLESTINNIKKIYKTLPRHLQFLFGIYSIDVEDNEVKNAIDELNKAGVISKIIDPRVDLKTKLKLINEELLPNFVYFLKIDKKNWIPKKIENSQKQQEPQKQEPQKQDSNESKPTQEENTQKEEYIENPSDFDEQENQNQQENENSGEQEFDEQEGSGESEGGTGNGESQGDAGKTSDNSGQSPSYNRQYDTPEGGKFEKNNTQNGGYKIEICPPMKGYYTIDNKSHFNPSTKKWNNIVNITKYDSTGITFKGKKHTLSAKLSGPDLKSIPLPKGYGIDLSSLKYTGDKPEFFRDENGAFFLGVKKNVEFSVDFYEEQNPLQVNPIKQDLEKLYNGNLTSKAQDAISKAKNEANFNNKIKIIIDYIASHHFYPPGKDSQQTMNNAKNLQANLSKRSKNGREYIINLDASKHLECYSANTLFIAILRELGINARLATGHHLQGEINKNGKSEINSSNGHAWSLVWDGRKWIGFDATPSKDPNDPRNKKDPKDKEDEKEEEKNQGKSDEANDGVEKNDSGTSQDEGQEGGDSQDGKSEGSGGQKANKSNGEQKGESNQPKDQGDKNGDSQSGDSKESGNGEGEGEGGETDEEDIEHQLEDIYKDFENQVSEKPDKSEIDDYIQEIKKQAVEAIEIDKDEKDLQHKYPGLTPEQIKQLAKFVKEFRKELDLISRVKNPLFDFGESENETLEQELKSIFDRIISRSLKDFEVPRFPVDDGYNLVLVDPVQLYIDDQEGRDVSYSYIEQEIRQEEELKIVKVRKRKIIDGSGSMKQDGGNKLRIQQQIEVIENKVTAEKQIELNELSQRLDRDVRLETETWQFGVRDPQTGLGFSRLKELSSDFDELEQASIWNLSGIAQGGTNDFDPLETIYKLLINENLNPKEEGQPTIFERIRAGYLVRQIKAFDDLEKEEENLDNNDKQYFENLSTTDIAKVFLNLILTIPYESLEQKEIMHINDIFNSGNINNSSFKSWFNKYKGTKILSDSEKEFFSNLDIQGLSIKDIFSQWLDLITQKYDGEKIEPILEVIEISSDGGSNDTHRLQNIVGKLRSLGVIVVAYGIGRDGTAVESTYKNEFNPKEGGQYCNNLMFYPQAKAKMWSTILDKI